MYQLARLSQWPQRPSQILNLSGEGFSPAQCLDFDFAVGDFWDWLREKQDEQVPVPAGPELRKGMKLGPKYQTLEQIFELYGAPEPTYRIDPEVEEFDFEAFHAAWDDLGDDEEWNDEPEFD